MWEVIQTNTFYQWFVKRDKNAQEEIREKVRVLEEYGPRLGRPYVDTVSESKFKNMKELRVQSKGQPLRVFFAFDPRRKAVLLVGGNKRNYKKFYKKMIFKADALFNEYLEDQKNESQKT